MTPFILASMLIFMNPALAETAATPPPAAAPKTAETKPAAPTAEAPKPIPVKKTTETEEEEQHRLVGLRINLLPLAAGFVIGKGGIYSLGTEIRIIDALSAGPNFAYAKLTIDEKTVSTFSYGVRLNWYMSGKSVGSGWYLSPYFTVLPLKASSTVNQSGIDIPVEAKYSSSIVGATIGYQWLLDFGMTFNIGLGAFHLNAPPTLTMTGTKNGITASEVFDLQDALTDIPSVLPEIEIGIGFAF